jgi:hypothetical protein
VGRLIKNDAIIYEKLNPRLPWQKQQSTRRVFIEKLYSDLKKTQVKGCIWSIALCGAENWIQREVNVYQK